MNNCSRYSGGAVPVNALQSKCKGLLGFQEVYFPFQIQQLVFRHFCSAQEKMQGGAYERQVAINLEICPETSGKGAIFFAHVQGERKEEIKRNILSLQEILS